MRPVPYLFSPLFDYFNSIRFKRIRFHTPITNFDATQSKIQLLSRIISIHLSISIIIVYLLLITSNAKDCII